MQIIQDLDATYTHLRKRLDDMGYIQPFGPESISLIQSLITDLNSENTKPKLEHQTKSSKFNIQYKPILAKLLRNICQLNEEKCKINQTLGNENEDLKRKIKSLEEINANYEFRETQLVKKICAAEKDIQEKSRLLLKLEDKNLKAIIHTPGGHANPVPFKRQRMVIDTFLPAPTESKINISNHRTANHKNENNGSSLSFAEMGGSTLPSFTLKDGDEGPNNSSFIATHDGYDNDHMVGTITNETTDILNMADNLIQALNERLTHANLTRNGLEQQLLDVKQQLNAKNEYIETILQPYVKELDPNTDDIILMQGKFGKEKNDESTSTSFETTTPLLARKALILADIEHNMTVEDIEREYLNLGDNNEADDINLQNLLSHTGEDGALFTEEFLRKLVTSVGQLRSRYEHMCEESRAHRRKQALTHIKCLEKESENLSLKEKLEKTSVQKLLSENIEPNDKTTNPDLKDGPTLIPSEPNKNHENFAMENTDDKNLQGIKKKDTISNNKQFHFPTPPHTGLGENTPSTPNSSENIAIATINDINIHNNYKINENVENQLKQKDKEFERINKLYKHNLEAKTNLTFRVNQLLKHERDLVSELEKLHRKTFLRTTGYNNTLQTALRTKNETIIQDLEKDRNFYRDEYMYLQKYLEQWLKTPLMEIEKSQPTTLENFARNNNEISQKMSLHNDIKTPSILTTTVCHPKNYISTNLTDNLFLSDIKTSEPKIVNVPKIKHSTYKPDVNSTEEFSALERLIMERDEYMSRWKQCEQERLKTLQLYNEMFSKVCEKPPQDVINGKDETSRGGNVETEDKKDTKTSQDLAQQQKELYEKQIRNLIYMSELLCKERSNLLAKLASHNQYDDVDGPSVAKTVKDQNQKNDYQTLSPPVLNLETKMTKLKPTKAAVIENKALCKNCQDLVLRTQCLEIEKITLQNALNDKERTIDSLHNTLRKMEIQVEALTTRLETKECKLLKTSSDINLAQQRFEQEREAMIVENRLLRKDLKVLTNEHKILNKDLENVKGKHDTVKEKLDLTEAQLKSLQQILSAKEQEKNAMLEQCKALEKQLRIAQNQKITVETELRNYKQTCKDKIEEMGRLTQQHGFLPSNQNAKHYFDSSSLTTINTPENNHHNINNDFSNDAETYYKDNLLALDKALSSNNIVVQLQKNLESRIVEISQLKADIKRLEIVCQESTKAQNSLKRSLEQKNSDTVELQQTLQKFERDHRILRAELDSRRQSLRTLHEVITCAKTRENNLRAKIRKLETKLKDYLVVNYQLQDEQHGLYYPNENNNNNADFESNTNYNNDNINLRTMNVKMKNDNIDSGFGQSAGIKTTTFENDLIQPTRLTPTAPPYYSEGFSNSNSSTSNNISK